MKIDMPKEVFNRKMPFMASKLNIGVKNKLVSVMFGALLYMAQRPRHRENWSGNNWRALKFGTAREMRK